MKKIILILIFVSVLIIACSPDENPQIITYKTTPQVFDSLSLMLNRDTLAPVYIQQRYDTFFVSYTNKPFIDMYSLDFKRLANIPLIDSEPVYPTSFYVSDSAIYVADHTKGVIVIYDRQGKIIESFGMLPDNQGRIAPFALTYYGGVLYVGDVGLKRVLAISMVDAEGITEQGELILSIPSDSLQLIEFPSLVYVTYDGRLIAGDAAKNKVGVYSCDGRYLYDFDSIPDYRNLTPMGLAIDDRLDPDLKAKDSISFDPSGIREMGRIHIVDSQNGKIHMFNPLGHYLASYPDDNNFEKPSEMVFDPRQRVFYLTDPKTKKIYLLK